MTRIAGVTPGTLPANVQAAIDGAENLLGFVPNDALVMARHPALLHAFGQLVASVYAPGTVDSGLKRLIGMVTSSAAGCTYCTGHTAFTSQNHGVDADKVAAVWNFECSELFSDAEKAALRVAMHAGQTPNGVTDEQFAELAKYFDVAAQIEIVAVIALFGFLNRWNSTLNSELEALPRAALELASSERSSARNKR